LEPNPKEVEQYEAIKKGLEEGTIIIKDGLYVSKEDNQLLAPDRVQPQDKNNLHQFETGAIRSKDADEYAFDLISPIVMSNISLCIFDWSKYTPTSLLNGAIQHAYLFLSGPRSTGEDLIELCHATICTMAAEDSTGTFIYNPESECQYTHTHTRVEHQYNLLPINGLKSLAATYKEGSIKYSAYNWEKGINVSDLLNHSILHIFNYFAGDRSENHLGHASWGFQASIHSYLQWSELNQNLRKSGCRPPCIIK
jgi:hypothetical protein